MIDMLADPIGAEHESAGAEGALVQPLDRLRVAGGLGKDGEREIVQMAWRDSISRACGPSVAAGLSRDRIVANSSVQSVSIAIGMT